MRLIRCILTHLPLVPHICVSQSGQHWFRKWLFAYSAPSHYLNQCWVIVNWTLRNKFQWNFNQYKKISFTKMHLKIPSAKCAGRDGKYLCRVRWHIEISWCWHDFPGVNINIQFQQQHKVMIKDQRSNHNHIPNWYCTENIYDLWKIIYFCISLLPHFNLSFRTTTDRQMDGW